MAKKTRNRKKNTDGDDLIDDDAVSVAVAEKPARKARVSKDDTAPEAKKTGASKAKKTSASKAKVSAQRNRFVHTPPKAGKVFTCSYKGTEYKMTIQAKDDGIVYVVQGKSYPSARRAASAVAGTEKNGWTFCNIVG